LGVYLNHADYRATTISCAFRSPPMHSTGKMGCMRVPLVAELSSRIPNIFWPVLSRIFVWLEFCRRMQLAESQKLDKQSLLPKKELLLLINVRLLPPSSLCSLASSTNEHYILTVRGFGNVMWSMALPESRILILQGWERLTPESGTEVPTAPSGLSANLPYSSWRSLTPIH